jgi:hypothetical protein
MIDTLGLQKAYDPMGAAFWIDKGFIRVSNNRLALNNNHVGLTVYPNGYRDKDHLLIEASIPRLIFGENVTLPSEHQAREGAVLLCGMASAATRLPFNINDAMVSRVDYRRNFTSSRQL